MTSDNVRMIILTSHMLAYCLAHQVLICVLVAATQPDVSESHINTPSSYTLHVLNELTLGSLNDLRIQ